MRILMVTSPIVSLRQPFKGGTEAFVVSVANGFAKRGHQVDVLCQDADEDNKFNTLQLQESAFRMQDAITSENEGQKLFQAAQFGLFDSTAYDVVHFHSYYHAMYEFAFFHQRSNIITLHSPLSDRLALTHQLNSARGNDRYIAVSSRLARGWENTIQSDIAVIPNGIDFDSLPTVGSVKPNRDAVWAGRICPEKDPVAAIKAAVLLDIGLDIYGAITDTDYFEKQIRPLLNHTVRYRGHLSHHALLTKFTDYNVLFISALWEEPFGLITLEALAMGLPVIGTSPAIPEELRRAPLTQVIDITNEFEVKTAYQKALKTSPASCRQFAKKFDISHTLEAYEMEYEHARA
ncbi:glycosyltransferase [Alteromonas sp. CI.11.F.A3]|uniref:glycosyltransferase n=1 Tax=Alteromonas sp. CI.11.F.A3 TaxID=3079555 RepID=UPI00294236C8|nr:glycosyltransferase [Alteromonas sp. CI.11.F.A3]WOI38201.1 glycosyltransferase [Alteromonas sp. CI.11.F.A3]